MREEPTACERSCSRSYESLKALAHLASFALKHRHCEEVIVEAGRVTVDLLAVDVGAVLEWSPDGDHVLWRSRRRSTPPSGRASAAEERAGNFELSPPAHVSRDEAGLAGYAALVKQTVTIDDVSTDARFAGSRTVFEEVVSAVATPIFDPEDRESTLGAVFVGSCVPRVFEAAELDLLEAVADVLGATLRRAREATAIELQRDAFRAVIEQFPAGVVFHDIADKDIKLISRWLDLICGYEKALPSVPLDQVIARYPAWFPDGRKFEIGDYAGVRALRGESVRQEMLLGRVDGTTCAVIDTATPVHDRHGRVIGSVASVHDISAEKAAAAERERLLEEAKRAVAVRDEILAVVSHDLRNPTGVVTLAASRLRHEANAMDGPRIEKLAEQIHRAARGMQTIIGDLLDRARIETGRFVIAPRQESIADVVIDAVDGVQLLAEERGIVLRPILREIEGVRLPCDRPRIIQVLSNLMTNALKFGSPGHRIDVGAYIDGGDAVVFVHDEGPGIAEDELPHVFERYWQSGSAKALGLGLGLAIVKGIIEAHGGRVWVMSPPNDGATFAFSLPLEGGAGHPKPERDSASSANGS